jgi:hypothetical protein
MIIKLTIYIYRGSLPRDDGEDFYKGDCRNSLTNLKTKTGTEY